MYCMYVCACTNIAHMYFIIFNEKYLLKILCS